MVRIVPHANNRLKKPVLFVNMGFRKKLIPKSAVLPLILQETPRKAGKL
jgi:hypothetical protein